jgi:hypothetical protein
VKWSVEWGKHAKFLRSIQHEMSNTPTALKNEPILTYETMPYIKAFSILSNSHQVHDGIIQPIPLTEMESYCRLFNVDDIELFIEVMHAADQAYMEHFASKQK